MIIDDNLEALAKIIMKLENECQEGRNISKNTKLMEQLMSGLSFNDLMKLSEYLEDPDLQN